MNIENVKQLSGGKKKDWDTIRENTDQPIITIITSTYNVINDLPWTMESIKNQTYPYVQWIVADGSSSDGTVELLQQYSDVIDYWFSEPDAGIYDAWNKALKHVKGDWVQFLGAGDELYEVDTLEKAAQYLKNAHPEHSLVYGQVMHISEKGRKELYVSGEPWENYAGRWEGNRPALPVQTAIFHHKKIFLRNTFSTDYKIISDCILLLNYIDEHWIYMPMIINKMPKGGLSGSIRSPIDIFFETKNYMKQIKYKVPVFILCNTTFKVVSRKMLLSAFGEKIFKIILNKYRKIRKKSLI